MSLQQLSKLVDYLPEEDLKQLLNNASSMPPADAAELFKGFLGESPASLEFISSFNSRRQNGGGTNATPRAPPSSSANNAANSQPSEVPRSNRANRGGKKKANIHTPAPRQVVNTFEGQGTAYRKHDDERIAAAGPSTRGGRGQTHTPTHNNLVLRTEPPNKTQTPPPRPPPSAAGRLISDSRPKPSSAPSTRSSSPHTGKGNGRQIQQKVVLTGGTPMSSASKALEELDALIKTLESGSSDTASNAARACNCIATRHPLLAAAPNCLNCGKVICVKEGFGPCTFCGHDILRKEDRENMVRSLKEDRAQEKMAIDRALHKKTDTTPKNPYQSRAAAVPAGPTPAELARGSGSGSGGGEQALTPAQQAQMHRDKLLNFQAQNAARTTVHDEAADFATPELGVSQWVGPMERARLVKQQQKVLREQEWNARPEWEKKREMVSLDVVNGKVVRKYKTVQHKYEAEPEQSDKENEELAYDQPDERVAGGGTFSKNPLLGGMIRPTYKPPTDEKVERKKMWRRVQDDYEDNEDVILDGGVYGGRTGGSMADPDHREGADERANT